MHARERRCSGPRLLDTSSAREEDVTRRARSVQYSGTREFQALIARLCVVGENHLAIKGATSSASSEPRRERLVVSLAHHRTHSDGLETRRISSEDTS